MVELQETLSFDDQILPLLLKEREKYNGKLTEESTDADSLKKKLEARFVGQERDYSIIVTWNDASPGETVGNVVTYFAVVSVVGASVNQERTLLVIYKSFLAEIEPRKRIYSLAIERHNFQRLQFLYGEYGSSSKKESYMLFLHHNEAIGIYHIPLARSGEKGMFKERGSHVRVLKFPLPFSDMNLFPKTRETF
ncbi:hypothetical protein P5673_025274 [Acropora cervicornis]|uniref:Uncharacterized protein n=1 Tax=Acropora cervicornis TaxID=6130 RepID=A0AAD9UXL5_ACRCE|nr:hypothetical protein P5673_025274 [Acropora cervicornis]